MTTLNEHNYHEIINGYTRADWQPLLDLIPEIENATSFSKLNSSDRQVDDVDSVIVIPRWSATPVVYRFEELANGMPIIIDFNWGGWEEGREMASNEDFDYDTVDIPTLCKMITGFVRSNRFCEGALADAFKSWQILKILKSIERQVP